MQVWRIRAGAAAALFGALLAGEGEPAGRQADPPLTCDPKPSIDYILRHQNEDGTWFIGMQVNPDSSGGVTVGTTALAAMALLGHLETDPERIKPAVDRAVKACLKYVWRKAKGAGDFESVNWGQIYTLQLLGRVARHPAWKERSEALHKDLEDLLPWFYQRRQPRKGWGYNSTFQSAAALLMLHELEGIGAPLPLKAEVHAEVAELLRANRSELGYDYNIPPPGKRQGARESPKEMPNGSVARDGACDLALYRHGKIAREEMEEGLRRVIDRREFMWKMRKLARRGEWPRIRSASPNAYFPFWGYFHTAAAVGCCGPELRKTWARLLYEDLMKVRELDGTWINLPFKASDRPGTKLEFKENGDRTWRDHEENVEPGSKIYATAMALMTLESLKASMRD